MDYKDYQAGQTDDNFWFRAKYKLIHTLMEINTNSESKESLKILSIGTGTGGDLKILKTFGHNYVTDILPEALALVPDSICVDKSIANACDLPYEDNFFDIAVSFDVFEHIEDHKKAVSEVRRTLKKGGILVYSVPACPALFSSHDVALEHFRRYNKQMLKDLFVDFDTTKMYAWNTLLYPLIAFSRILNKNQEAKIDHPKLPKFVDTIFYWLLLVDNCLIRRGLSLPIGISIAGWCKK